MIVASAYHSSAYKTIVSLLVSNTNVLKFFNFLMYHRTLNCLWDIIIVILAFARFKLNGYPHTCKILAFPNIVLEILQNRH